MHASQTRYDDRRRRNHSWRFMVDDELRLYRRKYVEMVIAASFGCSGTQMYNDLWQKEKWFT